MQDENNFHKKAAKKNDEQYEEFLEGLNMIKKSDRISIYTPTKRLSSKGRNKAPIIKKVTKDSRPIEKLSTCLCILLFFPSSFFLSLLKSCSMLTTINLFSLPLNGTHSISFSKFKY